ncbi:MAG: DUF359 domain-containing protein [Candidatus Bathyarchaeia archaeon]
MKIEYALTPKLRIRPKEPFGTLIKGSPQETMTTLKKMMIHEKPPRVVSVGDIVSNNMHKYNIQPQLTVIDYISLRNKIMPIQTPVEKTVYVTNPQGTISDEAINAIKDSLNYNAHTHIVVNGEEDLLTLIAVLYAPQNSFIIYGQPDIGIVVVKATEMKKAEVKQFLNEMKLSKS